VSPHDALSAGGAPAPIGDEERAAPTGRAGDAPLVLVVSSDPAVARSLVLLLEAEEIATRSFPSAATFLAELPALAAGGPGGGRCLLAEERLAEGGSGLALAERMAASGLRIPTVILKRAFRSAGPRRTPPSGVSFADPFHMDALLQQVRSALRADARSACQEA
jgi:FixJ family two-component response regulator